MKNNLYLSLITTILAITAATYFLLNADAFDNLVYFSTPLSLRASFIYFRLYIACLFLIGIQSIFTRKQSIYLQSLNIALLVLGIYFLISNGLQVKNVFYDNQNFNSYLLILGLTMQIFGLILFLKSKKYSAINWSFFVFVPIIMCSTFLISPPDLIPFIASEQTDFNQETLLSNDSILLPTSEPHIVAFYSFSCPFCLMSLNKLTAFVQKNEINPNTITLLFPESGYRNDSLFNAYNFLNFKESFIDPNLFFEIVANKTPLVILHQGNNVLKAFRYRDFDDEQILSLMQP